MNTTEDDTQVIMVGRIGSKRGQWQGKREGRHKCQGKGYHRRYFTFACDIRMESTGTIGNDHRYGLGSLACKREWECVDR